MADTQADLDALVANETSEAEAEEILREHGTGVL